MESLPFDERVERFWDRYRAVLARTGIHDASARWYVIRVEEFLRSLGGARLAEQNPEDLVAYLRSVGRNAQLESWQMIQVVHALELLFCRLLAAPWATDFAWEQWKAGFRGLEASHPTVARENRRVGRDAAIEPIQQEGGDRFDAIRQAHAAILDRLITAIRTRHYSIRTEQTYELWACRFIAFKGGKLPAMKREEAVRSFLEHLAVRRHVGASTQNQALCALVFLYKNGIKKGTDLFSSILILVYPASCFQSAAQ